MTVDVAGYKARVHTSASDTAIQAALDAAAEAILDAVGPLSDAVEHVIGGHTNIMLGQRASLILRVFERVGLTITELDPEDFALSASGGYVTRLLDGPNPSTEWRGQVELRYEPYIGSATRDAVQVELAALDLADSTGASIGARTQERIGEWSETFASTAVAQTTEQRREAILARLSPPRLVYWVGSGHSAVPGVAGS